jgi:hypothetical protein
MKNLVCCLALCAAAACGGKAKPVDAPAGAAVAWADMNGDQRHEFMEHTVLPHMKEKFVAYDAAEFGEMNCKTCHGGGVDDGSFEMPNPDILPLDFGHMDLLTPEQTKTADFMHTVVVPEMASLLGEEPYNLETQKGFGCLGCHTMSTSK